MAAGLTDFSRASKERFARLPPVPALGRVIFSFSFASFSAPYLHSVECGRANQAAPLRAPPDSSRLPLTTSRNRPLAAGFALLASSGIFDVRVFRPDQLRFLGLPRSWCCVVQLRVAR